MISLIDEACAAGARLSKACLVLNVAHRTVQRWRQGENVQADGRRDAGKLRTPANKLSPTERARVLAVVNSAEFSSLPPCQIVPALADQGTYLASESTIYRLLNQHNLLAHRGKTKPATRRRPDPYVATAPNQLWSWDITYLPATIKGVFFYLYLIMDVFSRKIVGWEVLDSESAELASSVFRKAHLREGISNDDLVLHSDNGSPMKGATMLATLQKLGVIPSFSRPSVSNDNPYSESLFKTLKYHPVYPDQPFDSIVAARQWVDRFSKWYNYSHRHSALKFVTPDQRHRGLDIEILEKRSLLYRRARTRNPERWTGKTRNWERAITVSLNPNRSNKKEVENTKIAA